MLSRRRYLFLVDEYSFRSIIDPGTYLALGGRFQRLRMSCDLLVRNVKLIFLKNRQLLSKQNAMVSVGNHNHSVDNPLRRFNSTLFNL